MKLLVAILVLSLAFAQTAHADAATSKAHYRRGMAAFVLDQFDEAIAAFEAGYREEPEPAFLFNLAVAHTRAGRSARAASFYRKYLELATIEPADRADIERRIRALEAPAPKTPRTEPIAAPEPREVIAPLAVVVTSSAPPPAQKKRPAWVWGVVGASLVLVVGGAVAGGVVAGTRNVGPSFRTGTEPNMRVEF